MPATVKVRISNGYSLDGVEDLMRKRNLKDKKIVLIRDSRGVKAHRVRLLDRVRARVRAHSLSTELANGISPDAGVALALHSQMLLHPAERRRLATALNRIMSTSARSNMARQLGVPLNRDSIHHAQRELETLIDRLQGATPVDVRGMAKVRLLIEDGGSPLYRVSRGRDLKAELTAVLAAIDPVT